MSLHNPHPASHRIEPQAGTLMDPQLALDPNPILPVPNLSLRYREPSLATYTQSLDPQFTPLLPGIQVLGRSSDCTIQLKHSGVTRFHAIIIGNDDRTVFIFHDLGSLNGTICEGHRVTRMRLLPEKELYIGPFTLRLCMPTV